MSAPGAFSPRLRELLQAHGLSVATLAPGHEDDDCSGIDAHLVEIKSASTPDAVWGSFKFGGRILAQTSVGSRDLLMLRALYDELTAGSGKTTHFAHTVDYATPFAHDFHAQ